MNSAFDYKVAGLSDDQIETGLELESKYGGVGGRNHDQMMDIVGLTGKYSNFSICEFTHSCSGIRYKATRTDMQIKLQTANTKAFCIGCPR